MKYCSNCGASLVDSAASFCSECGRPVAVSAKPAVQPVQEDAAPHERTADSKVVYTAQEKVEPEKANPEPTKPKWGQNKPDKACKSPKARQYTEKKKRLKKTKPTTEAPSINPQDVNYDGYYEDIIPVDDGSRRIEKVDSQIIKKAVWIAGGALMIIIAAIILLFFL